MIFKHYLITRFSVPFEDYTNDKNGGLVRTDEWLYHRFKLFNTYCLPSVKAQSNQGFTWLVFFDSATPEIFKNIINQIQKDYSNFVPLYVSSGAEFITRLNSYIYNNTKKVDFLITSRIDNDDAIHVKYIDTIQKEAPKYKIDVLLNFKWGIQLDIKTGILYQTRDESNPFITRICKYQSEAVKTIFDFGHHEAKLFLPIKQLAQLKGWLVIIHDKNVLNTIGGKPIILKKKTLQNYKIINQGKTPNILNLLFYAPFKYLFAGFLVKIKSLLK